MTRTWRSALMTAVSVVLAGSMSGPVTAQQQDDDPLAGVGPFSAVTEVVHMDDWVFELGDPFGRMYDWRIVLDAQATDPRFSGTWTQVHNAHGWGDPEDPRTFMVSSGTVRLENEDGAWVGELLNLYSQDYERTRMVVEGEGDYAGLGAIIDTSDDMESDYRGVVYRFGIPPLPEAIAADTAADAPADQ